MNIETLRREIDTIDLMIVALLDKRIRRILEIGSIKAISQIPIVDDSREDEVLDSVSRATKTKALTPAVESVYRTILSESRKLQDELRSRNQQ